MNGVSSAAAEEGVFPLAAVFASIAELIGADKCRYGAPGWEPETRAAYDSFGARYYSSMLGRFMTPDKAEDDTIPVALPYAEFATLSWPRSDGLIWPHLRA